MMLKAPFPWFGGKSRVGDLVWSRIGSVKNYVEPFYGSGAVHLMRPEDHKNSGLWPTETINDYDGYVANFWRAIKHDPEKTAHYADWPVNENDLHARHSWLVAQRNDLRSRIEGDPDWHDTRIAGYWVWGICNWIGSHFCSGDGPWRVVNRKLIAAAKNGQGVYRKRIHLGNSGQGVNCQRINITDWFSQLSTRLERTQVASGDWSRVCSQAVTIKHGLTGVFLDPPYGEEAKRADLYRIDSHTIAHDVRNWCIENGDNPQLRIALCGYDDEHNELEPRGWSVVKWQASGGYSSHKKSGTNDNRFKERIWFSPHCVGDLDALPIFAMGKT